MTQIVLILLLVLLIIIALNYKKIKYTKTYKKCLSRIRDFIDSQTKSKKKSKKITIAFILKINNIKA